FAKLARQDPRNPEFQRQLGRALMLQGKRDQAMFRARQAVSLKKDFVDAWLDQVGALNEEHRKDEALAMCERAVAANPGDPRLMEAKAIILRRAGQYQAAEAYLVGLLPDHDDQGWLHFQLGGLLADSDRERGNVHLRKAVALEPENPDYLMQLIEDLERTRTGDEGGHIEESYQLALTALRFKGRFTPGHTKVLNEVFIRVCDFDRLAELGDFKSLGRGWAESGRHTALLKQLARVETHEDRLELLEQHRIWGRDVEALAATRPVHRPPPLPRGGKIRLGFMSSDLRRHPVAYFAAPLFEHVDNERFEVFCYSFYQGQIDVMQEFITSKVTAFRWQPEISTPQAAQMIADDQLDMLIELGGTTHMNKLDVMAYRPAPQQASWLGYPHSAGLSTIDFLVCDPYAVPPAADLLVETPLMMPHTWLVLGQQVFSDAHPLAETLPQDRNGFITYGTANNPHKYSRDVLKTWARVVAATPDSRFAVIRPEGSSASFRKNILAHFEAEGVGAERVIFHTVRGRHMPFYNEVDITLDPFPLTGGTTTAESLWMGVPLISLVGEAFYERLSYSILSNAGLGDLCVTDKDQYLKAALALAADRDRLLALRKGLRDQIRRSPLGQPEAFARDFYDMIAKAVGRADA
ncbi:tetratricopeptide repeat protein, partial [Phenylobacterium sp.]|uniref:O-linked N-acetylglucosamine transferase, SPINDLY family protein n=1 Tax=Phenylobacterium sp. TaxID=1871053 RepID=UPI0039838BFB